MKIVWSKGTHAMHEDAFETIREELKQYNLKSVADCAGVSISTLYYWLERKGKPRYTTLCKVSKVLGFSLQTRAVKQ